MPYDLLIRGGTLWSSDGGVRGDLAVRGGKIVEVGALSAAEAREVFEAEGLWIFPGAIDSQVHFREPGMEHKEDLETGSRAAILGGVTTYFEMPNTQPPTTTLEALEDKLRRAEGRSWANYGFFVGAAEENLAQLAELENRPGTPGIKMFMGSSTGSLLLEGEAGQREALRKGRRRVAVHAEDEARNRTARERAEGHDPKAHPHLRDAESARLAVERLLRLSEETGRPVHVLHISSADELPLLAEAKRRGLGTSCEITPQHLFFSAEDYERLGTRVQQNPPIRSAEHRAALWKALDEGLFDVVGSDHAPHTLEEKAKPYPASPSGMPGVQTLLPMMLRYALEGRLSVEAVVRLAMEGPARLFGLRDKGSLRVGGDADLCAIDPQRNLTLERSMIGSRCGWSPFEGLTFPAWPVATWVGGRLAMREGELQGQPSGRMAEFDWKS